MQGERADPSTCHLGGKLLSRWEWTTLKSLLTKLLYGHKRPPNAELLTPKKIKFGCYGGFALLIQNSVLFKAG
jgi:hypothetical protein